MPSTDLWNDFVDAVQAGVGDLARNTVGDAVDQAHSDAVAFVEASEQSLKRWMEAVKKGILNKEDFASLVRGQRDLAKMHAITSLGLTVTRIERFRTGLISLVISSAFSVLKL
jgi:hypothetical protein